MGPEKTERLQNRAGDASDTVHKLAEKYHVPLARVQGLYERELANLHSTARLKDFVPVFASRAVESKLKNGRDR